MCGTFAKRSHTPDNDYIRQPITIRRFVRLTLNESPRLVRQALDIRMKVLGEVHPITRPQASTAWLICTWSMGDYAKPGLFSRQALEISYKLFGQSLNGLAERQQLLMSVRQQLFLDNYLSLAAQARVSDADTYGYVLASKGAVTARQSLISLERRRPELKPPLGTCERSPPAWPICHWPATDPKKCRLDSSRLGN